MTIFLLILKRFFGIIRAAGGGQEQPTVSSFMHLFRMLCIYYPINYQIKNGNVDNDNDMTLLTSYKECMLQKFKQNTEEAKNLKLEMMEILEENFTYTNDEEDAVLKENEVTEEQNSTSHHITYDLCGFLLHARQSMITCKDCWKSLQVKKEDLPKEFVNDVLVRQRDCGGLKWASPNLFTTIKTVEKILDEHFETPLGYVRDSFEDVIFKIGNQKIPPICCDTHREKLVPKLIYEYLVIRFRFKGKNFTNTELSNKKTERHDQRKKGKL